MRKTNAFPLCLFLFVTLVVTLGAASFIFSFLASAWIGLMSCLAAPLFLIATHFLKWHAFTLSKFILALLLMVLSLFLIPKLIKFTDFIRDLIKSYLAYLVYFLHR